MNKINKLCIENELGLNIDAVQMGKPRKGWEIKMRRIFMRTLISVP